MYVKKEESVRSFWENFKRCNIHIRWVPEGKEEQEIGNLFEKIMTENFPNLVKEIDMQVQGSIEKPKQDGGKEAHSKTQHN